MAAITTTVKKSIRQTIQYLEHQIRVTEVILFGSQADGNARSYSDIDIAVVSPDFDNADIKFKADIAAKVKLNCPINIEIHPVPQKRLKEARPTNFLGHILATGAVVYKNGTYSL